MIIKSGALRYIKSEGGHQKPVSRRPSFVAVMESSFKISFVLAIFVFLYIVAVTSSDHECNGEGLQPNHTSDCRQYYRCHNGFIGRSYSCPEGSAFSTSARQCLPRNRVPCVQHICHPEDASMYASPETQCRLYYKCIDGVATELACPSGSWFDFKRQQCSRRAGVCYEPVCTGQVDGRHPDTTQNCRRTLLCSGGFLRAVESSGAAAIHCPSPRTKAVAFPIASSDYCATFADGFHVLPDTDCRQFVVCNDGVTVSSDRCPPFQRFDGQQCVHENLFKCSDQCEARNDGFHVDLATGCTEYFYCKNHTSLFRATCPAGNVFDGLLCVSSTFYACPSILKSNPCIKKNDGFYRDFKDCKSFFYCKREEVMYRSSCPENQNWNGETCVSIENFQCSGPTNWPECEQKAPGFYQDTSPESHCRQYYHCSKNVKLDFVCPHGTLFDGENCVNHQTYTCPSLDKDSCENKPDGLYQQTSGGCRAYYMCSKGYKITYLCDVGFLFNGDKCVHNSTYHCPYYTEDCIGKPDGYHQDVRQNCRKYFYCENGEKLTTIQCSGNKLFNGQGCVSPKNYECPVGDEGNPCLFKEDGYYLMSGSHCRTYFKCFNRALISKNTCMEGQIFDGFSSCITKDCLADKFTCDTNGFFANLLNRCKSYYICTNGKRTEIECEPGKIFNGQICTPENSFQCPEECLSHQCSNTISSVAPY